MWKFKKNNWPSIDNDNIESSKIDLILDFITQSKVTLIKLEMNQMKSILILLISKI